MSELFYSELWQSIHLFNIIRDKSALELVEKERKLLTPRLLRQVVYKELRNFQVFCFQKETNYMHF